ncbi:MAG TPA: BlaI/MecI/CopY family transcriptional regulator [Gemmatimonadaceae bacterium]|jgi:predicted transcriptional regulator|nr:BlaI/MecI/CopY family transcriptional regulator [Gemmatimonadaceae bacterium]
MSIAFTDRELDIMAVLWDRGPSTAAEVREALAGQGADLAYNTVLTQLRILEDKKHVDHKEEGRAHRFRPLVKRREARASALSRTLDRLFGGSAEALVAQLVQHRGVTKEQLKGLRRVVDEELGSRPPVVRPHPKSGDRK